jgi:hypothetical protein
MDQAGIVCYFCGGGVFMHRKFWIYSRCSECEGIGRTLCDACNRVGCLVAPREDLDLAELAAEWLAQLARCRAEGRAIPPILEQGAERARAVLGELAGLTSE